MNSRSNDNTSNYSFSELVIASSNSHKLAELRMLLPDEIRLHDQSEFDLQTPEETGLTFLENALLKARFASRATGLAALADDSGLAVACLNGAPGIYSSRYAGEKASDLENCDKLLERMSLEKHRHAHFHCSIVIVRHWQDPDPIIAQGRWHGEITTQKQGSNGFGYDPLFLPDQLSQTAAQLDAVTKADLSHRGRALTQLKAWLVNE
ncbi:MAG: RdgB/HAM1 family non-canonical purine NTP pyrophosphatase [Gammaproteobacteria bacterium]|nr:RdgB/HAM1 family non-canonical purine NTP pyrophosphatase [Gammaproteobacteria bacterium]MBT5204248.1 RdgB/HAM1 family non-canonical purine NTP pyrophosphatase [Gammaproteobacteria bacterium]MBT5602539.1 RdgB/HAM1 family non-canonical purine NTP pyrophosphatase [Gammaproteobacteria bacterium]MBT6246047.1 RdgB/HAM1 family non-canonical purine NTP pyrophosphatase [Gammaproteobacteria bacterium]